MKLYVSATSPFARKCEIVAINAGFDDSLERIHGRSSPTNRNPDIAAANPLGKIPALILDDGSSLFDSRVICMYLAETGGADALYGAGAAKWTALKQETIADGIQEAGILMQYERMLRPEEKKFQDWIDGQRVKVEAGLDLLEAEVADLSGDLSIGQIAVGCMLGYMDFRNIADDWRASRPKLAAWYADFSKRSDMERTVPVE